MFPSARVPVVALVSLATVVALSSALAGAARSTGNAWTRPRLPWAAPAVPVGGIPVEVAVNQVTHTIYVGNSGENTVSVIDGTACNAIHTSGCGQTAATVTVGSNPLGVAIDQATNTIYVANTGENTVSVINGATCNRTNTSGCGQDPPTVTVGGGASLLAVDPATDTIYVGSFDDGTISVIDGSTCNGGNSSGCAQVPPTVTVGSFPDGVAVDQATHTVYVANGNDTTVSVIDGSRCNGTDSSGCGQTPPTVDVGGNPVELAVDQATDTVYVPIFFNDALGFVAMIDTATCNGGHSSGCSQPPLTAPAGSGPTHVTLNPTTHTVYVMNELDSSVSALNATTCNATVTSGCAETPPAMAMGFNGGAADVDLATDTVYASSQTANAVSVLDGAHCNASHTSGCTRFAPTTTVGFEPQGVAANQSTHTIYVANREGTVSVIDAAACNAHNGSACGQPWSTVSVGDSPQGVAVDRATDTIYTADGFFGENAVSVIDGRTCNAGNTSGCGQTPATVTAGNGAFAIAVNQVTRTIYVANRNDGTVSVIDGRTCNGSDATGCAQSWPTVAVGASPQALAVNTATNTIYVTNTNDNTVSVIDGSTCNGFNHSGCGQTPPTVAVGAVPRAVGVNQVTDTIYVGNRDDATVSVVDGRRCNGVDSSDCGQTAPAVAIGGAAGMPGPGMGRSVAVDEATDAVYVTNVFDSDVVLINGASCRAGHTEGCNAKALELRAGGWPINIALDEADGTLYVADNVDGTVSYFRSRG